MSNFLIIMLFSIVYLLVWVNGFRALYQNTKLRNRIALFISSKFNIPARYSYSVFATIYYCSLPILGSYLLGHFSGVSIHSMFTLEFNVSWYVTLILGIIAAMTLSSFGISLMYLISPRIDVPGEVGKIRWMHGIFNCPKQISWLLPMFSACVEELFFRGALLSAIINAGVISFSSSLAIVTIMFLYGQVILTDTKIQALVLSIASVVISIIGGLLFIYCKSIIPSIIMHASFAGFYSNFKSKNR